MKYMIASDIHGSAYYCAELMKRFEEEKPDKLILLGDLLYHGPRNDLPRDYDPKKVISFLNSIKNKIIAVRGNCDTEVDQMVLEFPIMADYAVLVWNNHNIYITHGHHHNASDPLPMEKGDFLLCGHTHVPAVYEMENFTYLNPGSVAIPKDGTNYSYMTLENDTFLWKKVEDGEQYASCIMK